MHFKELLGESQGQEQGSWPEGCWDLPIQCFLPKPPLCPFSPFCVGGGRNGEEGPFWARESGKQTEAGRRSGGTWRGENA